MAREYSITLGGKEYPLRYLSRERVALCKRFPGRTFDDLVSKNLMGRTGMPFLDEHGEVKRDPKGRPLAEVDVRLWDLEVLVAFMQHGVSRPGAEVTESQVYDWVDQHIASGKTFWEFYGPVTKAVLVSGVLGYTEDLDAEPSETGKGPEPAKESETQPTP